MKKNRKKTKKEIEKELESPHRVRDEEGRVLLNMRISDDSDFLSVFSRTETPIIDSDIAEFLENSTEAIPPKEDLTLRIYANCIDDEEQIVYDKAIREYYKEKYFANKNELKRNRFVSFFLGIAGILILALSILLDYTFDLTIWAEVVDIVAWVLLWESVDISVFKNRSLRFKEERYLAFVDMKIEYYPER